MLHCVSGHSSPDYFCVDKFLILIFIYGRHTFSIPVYLYLSRLGVEEARGLMDVRRTNHHLWRARARLEGCRVPLRRDLRTRPARLGHSAETTQKFEARGAQSTIETT